MRNVSAKILVIAGLAIGCSRSPEPAPPAPSAIEPAALLNCQPPKHLCPTCNGGEICALRCPECAPQVAPAPDLDPGELIALVCKPPQRLCLDCTGQQICARFCPECPAPLAPRPDGAGPIADLTCRPPQRLCTGCNGTQFCGLQCPACPPL